MKKEITTDTIWNEMLSPKSVSEYEYLLQNVGDALSRGRQRVASYIGTQTVRTYWEIGKYIVEYEQNGSEKAEYGTNLLKRLSRDLTDRYGTANSPNDICYDEVRLTIFESSDDFVLMPECPGMTDEEAVEVVKDWCDKNNIRFIDDMDNIEETYRAIYL